ncbi:hypothetical protein XFLAVUS301_42620 [Xanthobacter flavus]|uniref:Uncharacterized protein n=1 Tax=Xanthobacter flavus TaxID=281 RepID=A0A9W6FP29_XANFL|nr:hypothetical protein XFLAVUS301_42620 [Xanthobacter flavus]
MAAVRLYTGSCGRRRAPRGRMSPNKGPPPPEAEGWAGAPPYGAIDPARAGSAGPVKGMDSSQATP